MSDPLISLREHNRAVWSSADWDSGAGTRLLDVGTGSGGSVAIPVTTRGVAVTGADISWPR